MSSCALGAYGDSSGPATTTHTNSAISAVTRLRDMGIESFLLAPTIKAIVAQRLVRRLCEDCKAPFSAGAVEKKILGLSNDATLYKSVGCPSCKGTGYRGRLGLYEIVVVHEALRTLIHDDASEQDLARVAFQDTETLTHCGVRQVMAGATSVEEVLRVVRQDG